METKTNQQETKADIFHQSRVEQMDSTDVVNLRCLTGTLSASEKKKKRSLQIQFAQKLSNKCLDDSVIRPLSLAVTLLE